jgi:hypothetical protein
MVLDRAFCSEAHEMGSIVQPLGGCEVFGVVHVPKRRLLVIF